MLSLCILAVSLAAPPADSEKINVYRTLNVGDWVEYKSQNHLKETVLSKQTVLSKTDKLVVLRVEQSINGKAGPAIEQKIDLTGKPDPASAPSDDVKTETQKVESGTEKLTLGGKTYDCQWEKSKTTFTYKNPQIPKTEILTKRWWAKDVPFGGTVRIETTIGTITTATELSGFGSGK